MNRNRYLALAAPVLGLALAVGSVAAVSPGHGYVSVAPAAFHPRNHTCTFDNYGNNIWSLTSCYYYAPVQLPQGATVTKLSATWTDGSPVQDATATLLRVSHETAVQDAVAQVSSSGNSGSVSTTYTTTVAYNPIDNSQSAYYVRWNIRDDAMYAHNIVIEYTYQTSLPAVLRNLTSPRGH